MLHGPVICTGLELPTLWIQLIRYAPRAADSHGILIWPILGGFTNTITFPSESH